MRLIFEEKDGTQVPVSIGFQFYKDGNDMQVDYMPEPHKPSSSGKVTCSVVGSDESGMEYFANVYNMKWIEREDQGWISIGDRREKVRKIMCDIHGRDRRYSIEIDELNELVRTTLVADIPEQHLTFLKEWLNIQEIGEAFEKGGRLYKGNKS